MKLFEFQAKEIFGKYGIAVPKSALATRETIQDALDEVGFPCVLKSQVLSGGRGKAGLIRVVKDVEDARMQAADLFDSPHGVR
ncbi:MAG: ATP-grasp domain-containing protein, partial [Spirochaetaceae bacterium]|nr:ATP-grasp domain-containing protein [Spirochaetaceae bacterium]